MTDLNYAKLDRADGNWQSLDKNSSIKLVFDKLEKVKNLKFNSLRFTNSAIYPPEKVEVYGSKDGKEFFKIATINQMKTARTQGRNKIESSIPLKESVIRELRLDFVSVVPIPKGHRRAGQVGQIKIDEIVVD